MYCLFGYTLYAAVHISDLMPFTHTHNNDDKIQGHTHTASALNFLYFTFCFVCLTQVGRKQQESQF